MSVKRLAKMPSLHNLCTCITRGKWFALRCDAFSSTGSSPASLRKLCRKLTGVYRDSVCIRRSNPFSALQSHGFQICSVA